MFKRFLCATVAVVTVSLTAHAEWHYWATGGNNRFICEASADGTTTNWLFRVNTITGSSTELSIPSGNGSVGGSPYKAGSGVLDLSGFEADTGFKIVAIGGWMLGFTDSLKHIVTGKLVLPDVRSVGICCFSHQDITEVDAPELTEATPINKTGAFEGCAQLTKVSSPKLDYIGSATFKGCTALTDVGVLAEVTRIDSSAFQSCSALTAFPMTLPKVKEIGAYAFDGVPLTGDFYLPVVTNVGGWCFNSTALTGFHAPKLVQMNGNKTFSGCSSLTNFVAGHALRYLGTGSFSPGLPSGLVSFTPMMPRALTVCYSSALNGKTKLVSPLVWDCPNMTAIPGSFFSGCSKMCDITIGR